MSTDPQDNQQQAIEPAPQPNQEIDHWQAALADWDDDVPGTTARSKRHRWPHHAACLGPPEWRWSAAMDYISRQKEVARSEKSEQIWQAMRYLQSYEANDCPTTAAIRRACEINRDPLYRLQIEARLLARYTLKEVAYKTSEPPVVVLWYHDLFFDVLPRLQAKAWLSGVLFDPFSKHTNLFTKSVLRDSYYGRKAVCEHWLSRLRELHEPQDLTTLRGRENQQLLLRMELERIQQLGADGMNVKLLADFFRTEGKSFPQEHVSLFSQHGLLLEKRIASLFGPPEPVAGKVHSPAATASRSNKRSFG